MKLNLALLAFYLSGIDAQTDGNLQQPNVVSSSGNDLEIDLALVEGQHTTAAANTFNTRLLGGTLPGPTVRVKAGDWLYVNFDNDLQPQSGTNTGSNQFSWPDSTNLHFHGAHVSGERPGDDTTIIIDAQESFRYEVFFPQYHMGGTHWIHPHRHGSGTLQVGGGAAMALIVDDAPGEVPPEVANAEEVVLMFQHFDLGGLNEAASDSGDDLFQLSSRVGNSFRLVNGQYRPTLEITAGEWQRWRVIFGAWDRDPLDLNIDTGGTCEVHLLAKDGIYINDYPRTTNFYPISTAGRADIMVRCSAAGQWTLMDFGGNVMTLRSVNPSGGSGAIDVSTPPTNNWNFPTPSYLGDLRNRNPTPGCSCSTQLRNNAINGRRYNPNSFVHTVAQGSTVERTLQGVNNHPYHQHVYPFQITQFLSSLSNSDAVYHRIGDYHDTLMVRSSSNVRVKYEANNFHGRMAVHCHRLDHSDAGMLSAEDVVDPANGGVCDCNSVGYTRAPTPAPVQPTREPTRPPTNPPTPPPTPAPVQPTREPTRPPTPAPTPPPTPEPTNPPTPNPTPPPTNPPPTNAPVNPTRAPTPPPTDPPPTNAPVNPTPNPTPSPTNPPPTNAPVNPTPNPTRPPTRPPTNPPTPPPTNPPPTNPPVNPTRNPTSPTREPSSPTRRPTWSPTEFECKDWDLSYQNRNSRDCDWVGGSKSSRCNYWWRGYRLKDWCLLTCGECEPECQDDNSLRYKNKSSRNCNWVRNKKGKRCPKSWQDKTLADFCPETCGRC